MALSLYNRHTDIRYMQYRQLPWVLFVLWAFITLVMPAGGYGHDLDCWRQWADTIRAKGIAHAYETTPEQNNYLPLAQYFLGLFAWLAGPGLSIIVLKSLVWLADTVLVFMLVRYWTTAKQPLVAALIFLFNPAFFYNTLIWGQVDGIMMLLAMVAVQQAGEEKPTVSLWFFLLAVNFKLQAVIFLPLLILLWIPAIRHTFTWKAVFSILILLVITQAAILFPFWQAGTLSQAWQAVTGAVDYFPFISMNAYNWWYLWMDGALRHVSDQGTLAGITYHHWGLLLFLATGALALWPLALACYRKWRDREAASPSAKLVWITAALIPCIFFYFNTQMHERYIHMALLPLMALCMYGRRWWWVFVLFSLAYLLNLEKVLRFWHLPNYGTLIFHPRFIALLFGSVIVTLYVRLYRKQPADKPLR